MMVRSINLTSKVKSQIKVDACGVSHPVITRYDGRYVLGFFITLLYAEAMNDGLFRRPEYVAYSDIASGDVLYLQDTRFEDFSDADYERRHDLSFEGSKLSGKYLEETFAYLDRVRLTLMTTGQLNEHDYKMYLKRITSNVPYSYRRFFHELSV